MLPNFFVIGAAKAGTTALHDQLDTHPDIHMSAVKETDFFAPVDLSAEGARFSRRVESRSEYEALFDDPAPLRGESSPSYSMSPRRPGVAGRIAAEVPEARFLYMVRDPIDRILAQHLQRVSIGPCDPFEEMLEPIEDPANDYVCASKYMSQIDEYMAFFGPDRIMVVEQEDLRARGAETIREVFAFLDVDPEPTVPAEKTVANASAGKRAYSPVFSKLARTGAVRRALQIMPAGARDRLKGTAKSALLRPAGLPELSDENRRRLVEVLRPDADRLREFTGRDFDHWSL